jgi:hypothetical protein
MAHTVFICHSRIDKNVADAACALLESRRIPCWIAPRDILGGDEWGDSIVDAINECQIVLVIFSTNANTSPQVRREIERAVSKGKIILPFRIEDIQPTGAMEYALGNTHWLDALTPPMEASLEHLADTVVRIVNRDDRNKSPSAPPPAPKSAQQEFAPPPAPIPRPTRPLEQSASKGEPRSSTHKSLI